MPNEGNPKLIIILKLHIFVSFKRHIHSTLREIYTLINSLNACNGQALARLKSEG